MLQKKKLQVISVQKGRDKKVYNFIKVAKKYQKFWKYQKYKNVTAKMTKQEQVPKGIQNYQKLKKGQEIKKKTPKTWKNKKKKQYIIKKGTKNIIMQWQCKKNTNKSPSNKCTKKQG